MNALGIKDAYVNGQKYRQQTVMEWWYMTE